MKTEQNIKEIEDQGYRINQLLAHLDLNKSDFSKEIGLKSHSTLSLVVNNKTNISKNFIKKTIERFPRVNRNWLKTGEGEMIVDESFENVPVKDLEVSKNKTFNYLDKRMSDLEWSINRLADKIEQSESRILNSEKRTFNKWKEVESLVENTVEFTQKAIKKHFDLINTLDESRKKTQLDFAVQVKNDSMAYLKTNEKLHQQRAADFIEKVVTSIENSKDIEAYVNLYKNYVLPKVREENNYLVKTIATLLNPNSDPIEFTKLTEKIKNRDSIINEPFDEFKNKINLGKLKKASNPKLKK